MAVGGGWQGSLGGEIFPHELEPGGLSPEEHAEFLRRLSGSDESIDVTDDAAIDRLWDEEVDLGINPDDPEDPGPPLRFLPE